MYVHEVHWLQQVDASHLLSRYFTFYDFHDRLRMYAILLLFLRQIHILDFFFNYFNSYKREK